MTQPTPAAAPVPTLENLRACCYLDHESETALGRRLGEAGGADAAWGWLHVALVQARLGALDEAGAALRRPRQAFSSAGNAEGLAWCDEALAILLRRQGDFAASASLQAEIDARSDFIRDPLYRFVALNSRAIGAKAKADVDLALRLFYAANEAALECSLPGPRMTALANLGGYHMELFNLDDARRLSREALELALAAHVPSIVTVSATNLVFIHHASGEPRKAREMAAFMLENPQHLLPGIARLQPKALALGHLAVGEIDAALGYLRDERTADFGDGDGLCDWAWIKARCLLARADAAGARAVAEELLRHRRQHQINDNPYAMMQLLEVLADACEQLGDHKAALGWQREAHARYVHLVGRSARARQIVLEVGHQLASARRERDRAVQSHRTAENDRRRLAELNAALQAKIAETEQLHLQLKEQALHDPLTGLHNRRYLFEAGPSALHLARRNDEVACVALVDLDHFKLLNDTCGHAAGDHVLQRFAELLREHLRGSDIVCRYGGEEFVAVMPGLGCGQAQAVLERLQEELQQQPQPPGLRRALRCSFSAGIAQFPQHGNTLEQLLARADKALYRAKHLGRSRAEQASATTLGTLS